MIRKEGRKKDVKWIDEEGCWGWIIRVGKWGVESGEWGGFAKRRVGIVIDALYAGCHRSFRVEERGECKNLLFICSIGL